MWSMKDLHTQPLPTTPLIYRRKDSVSHRFELLCYGSRTKWSNVNGSLVSLSAAGITRAFLHFHVEYNLSFKFLLDSSILPRNEE